MDVADTLGPVDVDDELRAGLGTEDCACVRALPCWIDDADAGKVTGGEVRIGAGRCDLEVLDAFEDRGAAFELDCN